MDLAAGSRIGSYEILRPLGRGGMGEVYLASDSRLQREVALKLLPASTAADADVRARFLREARLAAALKHPHICTIYEVGEADGRPFIAMEFVEGTTLQDRAAVDLFSVPEVLGIGIQIADALEAAGARGIVHRDLKSANIVLTPRGDVKILDFGLAKQTIAKDAEASTEAVTEAGLVVGTAAYMSPEQALGQPLDPRSDLFSFGVVLYELLTGRRPFGGRTSMELLNAIVNQAPPPIPRFNEHVPDALVRVVSKLLEKDKAARYQSAHEVLTDLQRLQRDGSSATVAAKTQASRPARARAWWLGLAAVGVLAGVFAARRFMTPAAEATSVVVVPADVIAPPQFDFYKEGVPGTLSDSAHLAGVDGLDVKAPPTEAEWEQIKRDPQTAARAYGAKTFVVATVHVDANQLEMRIVLAETESRRTLLNRSYDGTPDRYLALMDAATADLREKLRPGAASASTSGIHVPAGNDAELAYREGLAAFNKYNLGHVDKDFDVARGALERALQLDPKLADAAAHIGFLYEFRTEAGKGDDKSVDTMEAWARRATEIDSRGGLGWSLLAAVRGRRQTRVDEWPVLFPLALHDALKGATFSASEGIALEIVSSFADSFVFQLAARREFQRIDPLYATGYPNLALALMRVDRSEEGLRLLDDATKASSMPTWTADARLQLLLDLHRVAEARSLLSQVRPEFLSTAITRNGFELNVAIAGGDADLERRFSTFVAGQDPLPEVEMTLALLARQGDRDRAFRFMDRVHAGGQYFDYDFLVRDHRLDSLRSDPRFAVALDKSRVWFQRLMQVLDDSESHGELPPFLKPTVAEMRALLKNGR